MKNKKLLWVLAPAVLVIWGIIIFQVLGALKGSEEAYSPMVKELSGAMPARDTASYTLSLEYADPFLKRLRRRVAPAPEKEPRQKKKSKVKKVVKKLPVKWPLISYKGVVDGQKKSLCLLEVDGSPIFLTQGEIHENMKLLQIYPDSIRVEYQAKEKKTIPKK